MTRLFFLIKKKSEELTKRLEFFETEIENIIEHEVQKRLVTNQGYSAPKKLTWNRLRFRSEPELEIAKVLDKMGVMFFPNASGRVMSNEGMTTREVDFLICWRGKWGILECDSEILHLVNSIKKGKLPSAASDHKRDNDFNRHGQWFIKRFTAEECSKNSQQVVTQFLDMLHKFHEDQHYLITGKSSQVKSSLSKSNFSIQYKEWGNELIKNTLTNIEDISIVIKTNDFWEKIKTFWDNSDEEGAKNFISGLKVLALLEKLDF